MIVVAGVTNVEVSVPVDGFPVGYVPVRYPRWGIGVRVAGVGFSLAAPLRMLNEKVRLATMVADDPLGRIVEESLRERGLWGPTVVPGAATPRAVVLHASDGRRLVNTDLTDLPDATYPPEVFAAALEDAEIAVVTNIGFARPLLGVAAERGVPVAADVHAVASLDDPYNEEWMAAARVLFCSDECLPCPPEAWVRAVWERYGCEIVVVGCGAAGAVLGVRDGSVVERVPAVAPRGVVNTAGAGDALAAAFLHTYTRTGDPRAAIRQAVLFAGYKVGAAAGEDGWLTGDELSAMADQ